MTIWSARQSLLSYATGVLLLLSMSGHADDEVTRIVDQDSEEGYMVYPDSGMSLSANDLSFTGDHV